MIIPAQSSSPSSRFAAKSAGVILLVTLITSIVADYFLVNLLATLQEIDGVFSLRFKTENELGALRSAVAGVLNPAIMTGVSLVLLKWYLPNESIAFLGQRFGIVGRPTPSLLVASFVCGFTYFATFVVLKQLFPPGESLVPHPDHVINYGSFGEKVLFVVAVITLVPITEEVLFRGILYKGIANSWGKPASALVVSAIFISLHPSSIETGYWVTHTCLYLFPFLMVALREIAGSLYAPIAAHSAFNFAEVFF